MTKKRKRKQVLIIGASGMAGHMIYKYLYSLNKYDLGAITRKEIDSIPSVCLDVEHDLPTLANIIATAAPDIIVNCVGLLVKACEACPAEAVFVNSFFPHMLENVTSGTRTKVIHLSSDCVFSGSDNPEHTYHEDDTPSEWNWYGRAKALGELINEKDLTLRLSIIGPEIREGVGLLQWFMKQEGEVNGFAGHYWNGITTLELAKQIDKIIDTDLNGLYHLAPPFKITKFSLLELIAKTFEKDIKINKMNDVVVNKVLANNRIAEYDPCTPRYEEQLFELKTWMETNKNKT